MKTWDNEKTDDLITTMLLIKNVREAKMFLRDLLTEKEIIECGNRWRAVQMLDQNVPYTKITKETGLSSTTIARISTWMRDGMGGYRLLLDRINSTHHHTALSRSRKC